MKYVEKGTTNVITTSNREYRYAIVCWTGTKWKRVRASATYDGIMKAWSIVPAMRREQQGARIVELEVITEVGE